VDKLQKTTIDCRRAEALLYPIAAFLLAGGLTKLAAQKSFAAAIAKAQEVTGRRIEHIGHPARYADIVALWSHNQRFLDRAGHPRPLLMDGKNEFRSLIRTIDPALSWQVALAVLKRYGNVRKVKGRYALVRPFFFTSSRSTMAFEPMAYFLSDASSTLGTILRRNRSSRGPELFWRKVETTGLSKRAATEFTNFVANRSLEFLEELDDWLETRRRATMKKSRGHHTRRVGIGLFSIYSNPETTAPLGPNAL
jgi:hypothetical protein